MFFQKKEKKLAEQVEQATLAQSPWSLVRRRFRANRMAFWSWRVLLVLCFVALFGDFIANENRCTASSAARPIFPCSSSTP
ncbi:MAG: hypothetical protein IPM82_24840 [Saprospiraceae bacterium]|nr:hypothetical protein [Saprospiraceae bacterium]